MDSPKFLLRKNSFYAENVMRIYLSLKVKKQFNLQIRWELKILYGNYAPERPKQSDENPLYKLIGLSEEGREDASINHDKYLYDEEAL